MDINIVIRKEIYERNFNKEYEDMMETEKLELQELLHCNHLNYLVNPNKINSLAWY